eukprot:s1804_g2.t1
MDLQDEDDPDMVGGQFAAIEIGPAKLHLEVKQVSQNGQSQWAYKTVLRLLFPGNYEQKNKSGGLPWSDIEATHRMLWPNVEVPRKQVFEKVGSGTLCAGISTSLLFSLIVWALRAPKRSPASRLVAEGVLAEFVTRLVTNLTGFDVRFPIVEANGTMRAAAQRIDSSLEVKCWSASMSNALQLEWDYALQCPGRPHTTRAHTSLVDFLVWVFRPVPLGARMAKNFRERKTLLETKTAASLVTYIALAYETHVVPAVFKAMDRLLDAEMESGDEEVNLNQVARSKRLRSSQANLVAEKAARLLYSGEETWVCDLQGTDNRVEIGIQDVCFMAQIYADDAGQWEPVASLIKGSQHFINLYSVFSQ